MSTQSVNQQLRAEAIKTLQQKFCVSRETIEDLEKFTDLLLKWNFSKINLISKTTIADLWYRHILDSAQLLQYIAPDSIKVKPTKSKNTAQGTAQDATKETAKEAAQDTAKETAQDTTKDLMSDMADDMVKLSDGDIFFDSGVLSHLKGKNIADLGSGAGFPAIVLSILGVAHINLIEKSPRKCQFLTEAAKISPNRIAIHNINIADLPAAFTNNLANSNRHTTGSRRNSSALPSLPSLSSSSLEKSHTSAIHNKKFDIITARALAPLDKLFSMVLPLTHSESTLIFPKGRSYRDEIASASRGWRFNYSTHQSLTSQESKILVISGLQSKPSGASKINKIKGR